MQNIVTAQASFQREQLGDAFSDGKPELFENSRNVAKYIADKSDDKDIFSDPLSQLIFRHKALDPTYTQILTLWNFSDTKVDKHLILDRIETAILDENRKKLQKLDAITLIQTGKAGRNSNRAAFYRRKV